LQKLFREIEADRQQVKIY